MSNRRIKQDEPYFDDCPICQAMKKMGIRPIRVGQNGEMLITPVHPKLADALRPAVEEAIRQGGIVGGPMFED